MSVKEPCALDDLVMRERLRQIIAERNIKVVVETGIHKGWSTIEFARMCETVIGIDNNVTYIGEAYTNIANAGATNVTLCAGDSPRVLHSLRHLLPNETLFLFDAHWQSVWPLLDEIKEVRVGTGVIVLHDIEVPDHPELGFDRYGDVLLGQQEIGIDQNGHLHMESVYKVGQPLNYAYVKDALMAWSPEHVVEYNERSEGTDLPRGVAYIFPR